MGDFSLESLDIAANKTYILFGILVAAVGIWVFLTSLYMKSSQKRLTWISSFLTISFVFIMFLCFLGETKHEADILKLEKDVLRVANHTSKHLNQIGNEMQLYANSYTAVALPKGETYNDEVAAANSEVKISKEVSKLSESNSVKSITLFTFPKQSISSAVCIEVLMDKTYYSSLHQKGSQSTLRDNACFKGINFKDKEKLVMSAFNTPRKLHHSKVIESNGLDLIHLTYMSDKYTLAYAVIDYKTILESVDPEDQYESFAFLIHESENTPYITRKGSLKSEKKREAIEKYVRSECGESAKNPKSFGIKDITDYYAACVSIDTDIFHRSNKWTAILISKHTQ